MPAASTKTENKISMDAGDPMKQILIVVEKKVRNLEKRKGKLDTYREKQKSGTVLEKDQQIAVDKYNEVEQNLIFAQELQKQFAAIGTDVEKFNKKQAKKDRLERQATELKRVKEMLRVQNLLDSLGSDQVRSDFQKGRHGAVVLSEDNLNQLDELYKLINPSREVGVDYQVQLNAAADHVISLIDSKDKEVVGTTYKALKELIDDISNCGYFERSMNEETVEESSPEQEFVVVSSQEVPNPDSVEVQASLPPATTEQHQQPEITATTETISDIQDPDSFFSEAPTATPQDVSYQRQRPFQEIVSSVQGNFNFLQESTIDMESPHMDPAVVAAHPMPGRPQTHPAEGGMSQTFTNAGFGEVHQQPSSLTQPTDNSQQTFSQTPVLSGQQSTLTGQEFTPQTYRQNSDSLFSEDSISQKVMGQSVPDSTISQFELPPQRPLPMPPSHDSTQQNPQSSESQGEKKFTMNPNAGVFQSQIYSSSSQSHTNEEESQQEEQSEYQSGGFQSSNTYRNNQSGWRGRGGRGGDRGGMSNGYHGNRNNRGSGNNYGGNRGGYQGYPQRENYRPDSYQGYNGNYSGGRGYKRDSQSRGGPRGAGRGGGPSRGRGGSNRGNSGGFGKPSQQAQQVS